MSDAPKFGEWLPIESAPKNNVIVLTDGGCLWQGFWAAGLGWIAGFDDGCIHVRVKVAATHWMHLPEPPKALFISPTDRENLNQPTQD